MSNQRRSFYCESLLSKVNINELTEKLDEQFVEVHDYRKDNRRVWISLDHVEAVAVDHGKLFNWRYPDGTYNDLKNVLMNRFHDPSIGIESALIV